MSKHTPIIKGQTIYPNINKTTAKYETDGKSLEDQEYCTDLLVTKADNKAIRKQFPKSTLSAAKEYTAEEFKKKYKFAPNPAYDSGDDEFLVIKFTKHAGYPAKEGKEPEPTITPALMGKKVVNKKAGIYLDADGNKFDQDVNLGSGTEGVLQYKVRDLKGKFAGKVKLDLHMFQVLKLVEYIPEDEGSAFDIEDADDEEGSAFDMEEDNSTDTSSDAEDDSDDDWDE